MLSEEAPPYRIGYTGPTREKVTKLVRRAASLGFTDELRETLKSVEERLRTSPLDWGEPERSTRKEGGCVYRAAVSTLHFYYAVYEEERIVLVLDINPMPNSPFA